MSLRRGLFLSSIASGLWSWNSLFESAVQFAGRVRCSLYFSEKPEASRSFSFPNRAARNHDVLSDDGF